MIQHETKNTSPISSSSSSNSPLREAKQTVENMVGNLPGDIKETATNIYSQATGWLEEGNNRSYAMIGAVTLVGVVGFFVGRGLRSSSIG